MSPELTPCVQEYGCLGPILLSTYLPSDTGQLPSTRGSQTGGCMGSPGGPVKPQAAAPNPGSDSLVRVQLSSCISSKFPAMLRVVVGEPHFENCCLKLSTLQRPCR